MARFRLLALFVCVLSPSAADAQLAPSASAQFRSAGIFYEKFFQSPSDGPREDVWATLMEIRLEDPISVDDRLRAYMRIELLQYWKLGVSPGLVYGFKRRGRTHAVDVYGAVQWNRPRSEIGDELEKADRVGGGGSYTYRIIAGLHLRGRGEYKEEFLKPERVTGSRFHEYGGTVSYRAFKGKLVPEAGYHQGERRTGSASGAYLQETTAFGIRLSVVPRVAVNARYREHHREYAIRPGRDTVARVDTREQVSCNLDIFSAGNLVLNLTGSVEKGESTRSRAFVARTFGVGFSLVY